MLEVIIATGVFLLVIGALSLVEEYHYKKTHATWTCVHCGAENSWQSTICVQCDKEKV